MRRIFLTTSLCLLLGAAVAFADTPIELEIVGNEARGTISIAGITAELTIGFESVEGLTPTALLASVRLVNPLDLLLKQRLGSLFKVPLPFPLVIRIAPSPWSTLRFEGVWTVSLYTHVLQLNPSLPLGLVKSDNGGPFRDITTFEGTGSYRVSGTGGGFSEFMIVVDLRQIDAVITGKFDALQAILDQHEGSMPPSVAATLQSLLGEARTLYQGGATVAAINKVTELMSYLLDHSGDDIPDVWDAQDGTLVNVAGTLRAAAGTLKFSLARKANME